MRTKKAPKKKERRGAGRLARTLRSLATIVALGVVLAVYNAVSLRRDIAAAIGPAGPNQERFFIDSADRPDIATFFKNLTTARRLTMSQNIGRYNDAALATLCGKCLDTFDPAAREALTKSLSGVAKAHPEAVAEQLKLPGSFQQLSIAQALRSAGDASVPLVDKQFSNADARPNAIAYLVAYGSASIGPTLPYLNDSNRDVRLAAADTLGKLRARAAVAPLVALYQKSDEAERLNDLTALAGIGDPSTQALMTQTIDNESLPGPQRAQAALGLGRIATPSALDTLWKYSVSSEHALRDSAISALQLAGDKALAYPSKDEVVVLKVAGGIASAQADSIIEKALSDSKTTLLAAAQASNRPTLVATLEHEAQTRDASTDGEAVDAILRALSSTQQGRDALKSMSAASTPLAGLANRRLTLRG